MNKERRYDGDTESRPSEAVRDLRNGSAWEAQLRRPDTALAALLLVFAAGCARPAPLTEAKAEAILRSQMFMVEPVYAEVPKTVSFGPSSPKDDFDESAVRTLENLERAGLVTVTKSRTNDGTESYGAVVSSRGFKILGTVPSARGAALRGQICEKRVLRIRNFVRHPSDPLVGRAEVVWQYLNPTPLYPLFETKLNKPLATDFISIASIHWDNGWKFEITVKKDEAKQE